MLGCCLPRPVALGRRSRHHRRKTAEPELRAHYNSQMAARPRSAERRASLGPCAAASEPSAIPTRPPRPVRSRPPRASSSARSVATAFRPPATPRRSTARSPRSPPPRSDSWSRSARTSRMGPTESRPCAAKRTLTRTSTPDVVRPGTPGPAAAPLDPALPTRHVTATKVVSIRGGALEVRDDLVVGEEPLEIQAAGPRQEPVHVAVTMRTPGFEDELAIGFLTSEGLLRDNEVIAVQYGDPG